MALRHATTAIKADLTRPWSSGRKRRRSLKKHLRKTDKKARLSLAPHGATDRGEESREGAGTGCHLTTWQQTANPKHSAAPTVFPIANCSNCHNTSTWTTATFDHSTTGFPLANSHQLAPAGKVTAWAMVNACTDCHVGGNYTAGYPTTDCYGCREQHFINAQTYGTPTRRRFHASNRTDPLCGSSFSPTFLSLDATLARTETQACDDCGSYETALGGSPANGAHPKTAARRNTTGLPRPAAQIANGSGNVEPHGGRHRRNSAKQAGGSMTTWRRLRSWLRAMARRSWMEGEIDTELRFHIEAFTEGLVRSCPISAKLTV